ncbi:MAG: hypothetical protein KA004_16715 [Verrucomicrobiales bacterium]|nr:hypothetical protein [Verrucomicrobiales bacterium]
MKSPVFATAVLPLPEWPFDLAATLQSGQVFHWEPVAGGWLGTVATEPMWLRQDAGSLTVFPAQAAALAANYLALDHPMAEIAATFPPADTALARAVAFAPGLRILRQPQWECLATFITSALKQVSQIRQVSLTLRRRFGTRHTLRPPGGPVHEVFSYPDPEVLAAAGESALRDCGMGFRAKSLHRAAVECASGRFNFAFVRGLDDAAASAELQRLHGVGEKIAHCVLLFACERLGAFPIDVWVERVLRELYFVRKRNVTPQRLRTFARKHFGPARGYAQQFLFHHARLTRLQRENAAPH